MMAFRMVIVPTISAGSYQNSGNRDLETDSAHLDLAGPGERKGALDPFYQN